jgi:hypothetical protein
MAHAERAEQERADPSDSPSTDQPLPAATPDAIDWAQVRRVRAPERLLPETERWAESLPAAMKPASLLAIYPRLANRVAIAWRDAGDVQEVLDDLLIDRRGGRRGFPAPVRADLVRLRSVIEAPPFANSACVRIHTAGTVAWALSRCRACGDVHKYRIADALAAPVQCRRCLCRMNIRAAVVEAMDRKLASSVPR